MSRWDTYQPFDPVPPTGDTIMQESWLLCLDEFMVRKTFQHFPAVFRIRIFHLIRIRGSESSILGWKPIRIQDFDDQKFKKMYGWENSNIFFLSKIAIYLSLGLHKEAFSPQKRTSKNMKFLDLFLFLWVIFALLEPDPDSESVSGYWSTDLIESGSNPDPVPGSETLPVLSG